MRRRAGALAEEATHLTRIVTSSTRRLYVDAIKWETAKIAGRKYHERVRLDASVKVTAPSQFILRRILHPST